MYRNLGVGWASSLLGFISVVTMFIPFVLFYMGPRLRERSVYM
jgi:DHA1 family multidrug resistance protein-like MFS transporter